MGWLTTRGFTKQDVINDRIAPWENGTYAGNTLRHSARGNVLWTVRTLTTKATGEIILYIGCDLLRSERNYGWGYKDMDESEHPYYYSCPLSYLDMVPVACEAWRAKVREYHAQCTRVLIPGRTYALIHRSIPNITISGLKPLTGWYNGTLYRVSKTYVGEEIPTTNLPATA